MWRFVAGLARPAVLFPASVALYVGFIGYLVDHQIAERHVAENKIDRTIDLSKEFTESEIGKLFTYWMIYVEEEYYTKLSIESQGQQNRLEVLIAAQMAATDRLSQQIGNRINEYLLARFIIGQAERIGICVENDESQQCDPYTASIFFTNPIYSSIVWWRHLVYCDKKLQDYFSTQNGQKFAGDYLTDLIFFHDRYIENQIERREFRPAEKTCDRYNKIRAQMSQ